MFRKPEGVSQEHIWVAEYYKGSLREFENNETENSFYDIDKDKLVRFGLTDLGWFECNRGLFNLRGQVYELIYKFGDNVVALTGQDMMQRDIITYKKAYAEADMTKRQGTFVNKIVAFYFGYKSEFSVGGIKFNFKPVICKPVNGGMYLDLHLVVDRDLDGELAIIKNGEVIEVIHAPLKEGVAGGIEWRVK